MFSLCPQFNLFPNHYFLAIFYSYAITLICFILIDYCFLCRVIQDDIQSAQSMRHWSASHDRIMQFPSDPHHTSLLALDSGSRFFFHHSYSLFINSCYGYQYMLDIFFVGC